MVKRNILIVDDEPTQCTIMRRFISNMGYNHLIMNSGMEVVDFFLNKKVIDGITSSDIDVMLLDLSMPDIDGLTVLKKIGDMKSDVQVIVLTATSDVTLAVNAINLGATDYIIKGKDDIFARLTASIKNAIDKKNLKYQVSNLVRKDKNQVAFSDIVGQSDQMLSVINYAKKAVSISIPILISGPSGTGKELLARAIHGSGARSGKPFIVIECDMIKPDLMEEFLFGLEKNIDNKRKLGKIKEAEGGTILFKKIEYLNIDIQTKLLRLMQDGEYFNADSIKPIKCNIRVIASTTKNLSKLVAEKRFREDLKYAISIFPINIPNLKNRGENDIKLLAESFLRTFSVNENKKIKNISSQTYDLLFNYHWKDNVRQLKNFIFRAVILCDEESLLPEHFPQILNSEDENDDKSKNQKSIVNNEYVAIFDQDNNCKTLADIEEEIAQKLMEKYNGNISEVSKKLNIARSTLYRKLRIDENDIQKLEQQEI